MSWEPKKTAVSALGLPRDVILGDVLISFVGRSQVNAENYRSPPAPNRWTRSGYAERAKL